MQLRRLGSLLVAPLQQRLHAFFRRQPAEIQRIAIIAGRRLDAGHIDAIGNMHHLGFAEAPDHRLTHEAARRYKFAHVMIATQSGMNPCLGPEQHALAERSVGTAFREQRLKAAIVASRAYIRAGQPPPVGRRQRNLHRLQPQRARRVEVRGIPGPRHCNRRARRETAAH